MDKGHDSKFIYYMRIFFQYTLVLFILYLVFSLICLCKIGGIDGDKLKEKAIKKKLKKVPFG